MMTEEYQTLGVEHTMEYTDDVLQNCAPEAYFINQCNPNKFN